MLSYDDIADAVDIQKRSYKLLLWTSEAIKQGYISFTRAHEYASAAESAYAWIEEHYENIPESTRPGSEQMQRFSNYFSSYVTTSFDLIREPGKRLVDPCGCFCELCSYLVDAPNLQTKKLTKEDKNRARRKCISRVEMLALEEGFRITPKQAETLVDSFPRQAAFSAYGQSLLERMKGSSGSIHILALWRKIAWKPEGSPIKGFELSEDDIYDAEHVLVAAIVKCGEQVAEPDL